MDAKRAAIERALDAPSASIRCYLLYGPDESGSRALAARLGAALGSDAERIDLSAAQIRADTALLSDEAASASLFGNARHIRVEGVGEDCLAAVDALMTAAAAGNPVVLIAGAIKKDGKLVKRLAADDAAKTFASYPPEDADADRIVIDIAHSFGLRIDQHVARRVAGGAGGDRALIAREIEKLALYSDAAPDRVRTADDAMLDAIGADSGEAEPSGLVDAVIGGNEALLPRELAGLAAEGQDGIPLVRAVLRRMVPMAAARAEADRGASPKVAVDRAMRFAFWREKEAVERDLSRWPAERIARAIERLVDTELLLKTGTGPGPIAAEAEFYAIARTARRRR